MATLFSKKQIPTSLNSISNFIKSDLKLFENQFDDALKSKVKLIQTISRFMIKQRGKRIRPILTLLASRVCGEPTDNTYKAAALIELMHIATLIHDDVVDEAVKRRGWFSIKGIWGNKLSVLMGDYVLSKSLIYMIKIRDFDALDIISQTAEYMSSGELIQLDYRFKKHPTEEAYFELIRQKTACLIAAGCELGALTTTKKKDDRKSMRDFGLNLGMAYQIRDDLFDLLGEESQMGKDKGIDVKKNNLTLPIIHSLQSLENNDRERLLSIIKKKNKTNELFSEINDLVERGNGFIYAQDKIEFFTQKAIKSIKRYPESDFKDSMIYIAQFNILRNQ